MDRAKLDSLYELYGFTKETVNEVYGESIEVYLFDQGYFHNAEIVVLGEVSNDCIESLRNEYISSGYSVSVKKNLSVSGIESELFAGFFKIDASNNRVLKDYDNFCEMQTKKNGGAQYSYIESGYLVNDTRYDKGIVEKIYEFMNGDGAQLIILEAPAGFGKTCTSYEISKRIASDDNATIPILAELSKNRTARIFEYVLYSEIDSKFTQLSAKLVTERIVAGKIPLIIDGFDELLSMSSVNHGENLEDAKSMLDTVANLLKEGSNAKVLLTARKSSIFVGEAFDDWVSKKVQKCTINRIQILNPTISDWIGNEKKDFFDKVGVTTFSIANPVMLSIIRNMDMGECYSNFDSNGDVLEYYIKEMLTREKKRQQLLISWEEQRNILQHLAASMVVLDVISEEPDGIKALIEDIVDSKIYDYLDDYDEQSEYDKPTEEEFFMKLVHNALLDRIKVNANSIGFINEFFFGIFIGEAIINHFIDIKEVKGQYLSYAISSFASEKLGNVDRLIEEISAITNILSTQQKLLVESNLTHAMIFDYVDEYISGMTFDEYYCMGESQHYFYNCIFSSCTFVNISLNSEQFEGCYFIECTFYNVEVNSSKQPSERSSFTACVGHEIFESIIGKSKNRNDAEDNNLELHYERSVLEQFWRPGASQAELRKTNRTLYKGFSQSERSDVSDAIQRLYNKGLLKSLKYCIELNMTKVKEVKEILGRQ